MHPLRRTATAVFALTAALLPASARGQESPARLTLQKGDRVVLVGNTFAERARLDGASSAEAALDGAKTRLRPILMTACAMMAGMVPMALAFGEGGEQVAPLGRAVIGGLAAATFATLFVLPSVFAIVQARASAVSASLDPDDPESRHYDRKE